MMKKIIFAVFFLPLFSGALSAGVYSDFPSVTDGSLKPFARDIGGMLGAGSIQTARSLGFSGFDVGVRGVMQFKPGKNNTVLKKNESFGLGWVQAELGMPYRIDGFVRAGSYDGVALAGGGLRYGLRKISDEPYYVQSMVVAMANMAAHKYFYATHFNFSLVFSVNIPYITPYFGAGVDNTALTAQTTNDASLQGKRVTVIEPRYTAGVRMKMKLGYLSGGATYTHGDTLLNAGAGLRF